MANIEKYEKFAPALESMDNNMLFVASTLESILNLTQGIFDIQRTQLDLARENAERLRREADFAEVDAETPTAPVVEEEKKEEEKLEEPSIGSFADILKALALAPFAFKFAKGFISAITDDLIEVTAAGITGLSAMIQGKMNGLFKSLAKPFVWVSEFIGKTFSQKFEGLTARIKKIGDTVGDGLKTVRTFFTTLGSKFSAIGSFFSKVANVIGTTVSTIMDLPILRSVKLILTKLAWPLTLFMGAWEAVKSFMNTEGSFMEKFTAGVGGFFAEIIGAPLDLLKSIVAWVLNKFGFEGAAEALSSFSFGQLIRDVVGGIFDAVSGTIDFVKGLFSDIVGSVTGAVMGAFGVIKDLFTWGEEDKTALGVFGKLTDIIYAPINMAIGYIRGMFGWGDPDEPFKLQDWIVEKVMAVIGWVKGLFAWGADLVAEGWTNLTDFVSGIWGSVKSWFAEKLGFGGEDEEGEDFSIRALFDAAIEKIKTFFTDLFDFLPSFDEIKQGLLNILPSWMRPDSVEEQRASIQAEIDTEQARIDRSNAGENEYFGGEESGRESSEEKIRELQRQLDELPQAKRGGIIQAPETGAPVMLHGQEAIIPLDSAEGESILAKKTEAVAQGSMAMMGSPTAVTISGGNTARGGDTYNNGGNTNTTTIINNINDPVRSLRHTPI